MRNSLCLRNTVRNPGLVLGAVAWLLGPLAALAAGPETFRPCTGFDEGKDGLCGHAPGYMDVLTWVSDDAALSFGLIDNVVVTAE